MFDHLLAGTTGTTVTTPPITTIDAWMRRLKAAYDAGYYRTEAAEGHQTSFPWQNKSCKDCPFWAGKMCRVFAEPRSAVAHTCVYFDEGNRALGQNLIQERRGNLSWKERPQ